MGNDHSTIDLIDSSIPNDEQTFKVDNINSHGRKHSSAKIQVLNDNLCIQQKHRESLHIPLETIKRYGLDGSIFILECGRRAPLGEARYAFRCKQARRLVDCLDQHIKIVSNQLLEQQQEMSSSSLTNVSSTFNHHHHHRGRTQSSNSLSSSTSFYRNSEPDLSENYFAFPTFPIRKELNYAEFIKTESNSSLETPTTDQNETIVAAGTVPEVSARTKSYVFIDHEKTSTLKNIAQERLQQQNSQRIEL
jgi:hypothetical protein